MSSKTFSPTTEQAALLNHEPTRHARVLAGPGTGKSATLVALVEELLSGENPPRIRLLTFTRAATAELAQKVSESPTAAAQRPSTIHSFAISVLLRNRGAGGFPEPLRIADDWEDRHVVLPTLRDRSGFPRKQLGLLRREMASAWESLTGADDPKVSAEDRARFLGAWNEHRRIYGYTLLSELPYALRRALMNHPELEGLDWNVLIVDEYQDLNACDLDVLHRVAERGTLIIGAGDDDQSIYSFRKANPAGIRRFPDDYANAADYPLSISHRCGQRIIEWANYVISGDPERPADKPLISCHPNSPPGEVALLSFKGHAAEPQGIAELVRHLTTREGLRASDVLILLRTDHNGTFSQPIKDALDQVGIGWNDPDVVERMLAMEPNRKLLEMLRLLVNREDSLAWASLLELFPGVGKSFFDYIYERALPTTATFAGTLLKLHADGFPEAPRSPGIQAKLIVDATLAWLDAHALPDDAPEGGWGSWIHELAGDSATPSPTADFATLLEELDGVAEQEHGLGRYLSQVQPLGEDIARSKSEGVRIMSMMASKGLTVRATILAGVEDGIVPRPDVELSEERRILYVAMTRAKEFLFVTWARRRSGPTARAGKSSPDLRQHSTFLDGGPVASQDGATFLSERWPQRQ